MKKIVLALALVSMAYPALAGVRCSTDYLGRQVCTGTGSDSGWSSTRDTDYLGRERWRDNSGNTTTCSTDYLGRYVCN